MMLWDAVGMSHHSVILVEAPHAVHFVVDAAGDVLNVLHVSPKNRDRPVLFIILFSTKKTQEANLLLVERRHC